MISKLIRWIVAIGIVVLIALTILNRQHYWSMLPQTLFSNTEEVTSTKQPIATPIVDTLSAQKTAIDTELRDNTQHP